MPHRSLVHHRTHADGLRDRRRLARPVRRLQVGLLGAVTCLAGACSPRDVTAPGAPDASIWGSPEFPGAAFVIELSTVRRTMRVSPPNVTAAGAALAVAAVPSTVASIRTSATFPSGQVQLSLLGGDAVDVEFSNYTAGAVGEVIPGKVLVSFDLTLINRLNSVSLVTPTFPAPPAGVTGVLAFPLEVLVLTTSGGVGSSGNVLQVQAPRFGSVLPSGDWDGAPHSFFNDADCSGGATDCFPYEPFGAIAPRGRSEPRRVGFLLDPTVGDVRIRLLVAADVRAATAPQSAWR